MKGMAYAVLFVVVSTIILGPFVECFQLITEKARLDSTINNCGKLAVMTSSEDSKARDMESEIDLEKFMEVFGSSFAAGLNLWVEDSTVTHLLDTKEGIIHFKSNDGRYNDFAVYLTINNKRPNQCEVSVISKYKFKTKHLAFIETHLPAFTDFNLERKSRFVLEQIN